MTATGATGTADRARSVGARLGVLALVLAGFAAALALGRGVFWLAEHALAVGEPGTVSRLLVGVGALQVVGFGSVVAAALWLSGRPWRAALRVGPVTQWVVFYGAAVGLVLMVLVSAATGLFALLDIEPAEAAVGAARDPWFYLVLFLVSTFVVVPLEEVFFRGFVQARLEEAFHPAAAVAVASVCFTLVHTTLSFGAGEFVAFALFFSLSVVLGVGYTLTGNLFVPVIGHALFNGVQILVRTLEVAL